jgi:hypothetical protein
MAAPLIQYQDLTFGIELEMVSSSLYTGINPNQDVSFQCIRETALNLLRGSAGVQAQLVERKPKWEDDDDEEEEDFSVWAVDFDGTIKYEWDYVWQKHHPDLTNLFAPQEELILSSCGRMAICHGGIEIISPILKWDSPQLWVPQVENVVRALTHHHLQSTVIPTSGFHVHIGLGCNRFSLDDIKKVAAVCILGETLMDYFHAPHRRDQGAGMIQSIINRRVFCGLSRQEIFEKIINAQDLHEFKMIISEDSQNMGMECITFSRFFKVNFGNVDDDDVKGTIEFRQHAGTLDPEEIRMWVKFTGLLVCHAANMNIDTLRKLLVESVTAKESNLLDPRSFMKSFIKDVEVARYYFAKIGISLVTELPADKTRGKSWLLRYSVDSVYPIDS